MMSLPFKILYSLNAEHCSKCFEEITVNALRIAVMVQSCQSDAKLPQWHHTECFFKNFSPPSTELFEGFGKLQLEDRKKICNSVGEFTTTKRSHDQMTSGSDVGTSADGSTAKKQKTVAAGDDFTEQMHDFFILRDKIGSFIDVKSQKDLLSSNGQYVPTDEIEILDHLTDIILFGCLPKCSICIKGSFAFNGATYVCKGHFTWGACCNTKRYPRRSLLKPLSDYYFLFKYAQRYKSRKLSGAENTCSYDYSSENLPLYNMDFFMIGKFGKTDNQIQQAIKQMGGKVSLKIHQNLTAVISTRDEVQCMGDFMKHAKQFKIHVIPVEFLDQVLEGDPISFIINGSLCDWGSDPILRIRQDALMELKNQDFSSVLTHQKFIWLNGGVVDPKTSFQGSTHVYVEGINIYSVDFVLVDIIQNKNSYHKLQILESNDKTKYWLNESWGRISTTIGASKTRKMNDKQQALLEFQSIYREKTDKNFGSTLKKRPNKFYHLNIEESCAEVRKHLVKSQLNDRCLSVMKLMFDENIMKDTAISFNIDIKLMPLGRTCKIEIDRAFDVLRKLRKMLTTKSTRANVHRDSKTIQWSNQFYSYVPHAFGTQRPQKIDTLELIDAKCQMLEYLKHLQFAYGLLHSSSSHLENPFDVCYRELQTVLEPLDKEAEDFKMICKYARNSHAPYHTNYTLEVLDAFAVERRGEKEKFQKFASFGNRMLLWHGSRLINFAGILSNGLKIAPPHAVKTGHYFGKGIYFSDMISKSANYTSKCLKDNVGLMLLCDVPLGEMICYNTSFYMQNLPNNINSLKGIGQTYLDESQTIVFNNKFRVPLGKAIFDPSIKSTLRHNEYVIYDESQVNIKYLVQVKFHMKDL